MFRGAGRVVVEVANLDNVITNTNLPMLIHNVLRTKGSTEYMTSDEVREIALRLARRSFSLDTIFTMREL